jgi:hypothetical protein
MSTQLATMTLAEAAQPGDDQARSISRELARFYVEAEGFEVHLSAALYLLRSDPGLQARLFMPQDDLDLPLLGEATITTITSGASFAKHLKSILEGFVELAAKYHPELKKPGDDAKPVGNPT